MVEYEPGSVTPDQIAGAINAQTYFQAAGVVDDGEDVVETPDEGASVGEVSTAVIRIDGMSDNRAVSEVMSSMGAGEAIVDAAVDLTASTLTVKYDPNKTDANSLAAAIADNTSFGATVLSSTEPREQAGAAARVFDYAKYAVWGLAGLLALGLAWSGLSWGRRQLAPAPAPPARTGRPHRGERRHAGSSPAAASPALRSSPIRGSVRPSCSALPTDRRSKTSPWPPIRKPVAPEPDRKA